MTRNDHSTPEAAQPVDPSWVAHLRDLSAGVTPPTSADPRAMSRTAIRRTRTRRAVFATGGGAVAVAAFAGVAFAVSSPTTGGVLLPGGSTSDITAVESAAPSTSDAADAVSGSGDPASSSGEPGSGQVPAGWHTHELEGLTYALPSEVVTSGPVGDEPGETSDMWHNGDDPDAPPFVRISHVTPDYEFYDTKGGGLTQIPGAEATEFELPGASVATVEDGDSEELREIMASSKNSPYEPVRIIVHREDGPDRYLVTMNLPKNSDDLVDGFLSSLTLD